LGREGLTHAPLIKHSFNAKPVADAEPDDRSVQCGRRYRICQSGCCMPWALSGSRDGISH